MLIKEESKDQVRELGEIDSACNTLSSESDFSSFDFSLGTSNSTFRHETQ